MFLDEINGIKDLTEDTAKNILEILKNKVGNKILMPLRIALTGNNKGPELYKVLHVLGKDKAIERIRNFISRFKAS